MKCWREGCKDDAVDDGNYCETHTWDFGIDAIIGGHGGPDKAKDAYEKGKKDGEDSRKDKDK